MRTIIIYDQCDADLTFYLVEEDKRHLDGTYINQTEDNDVNEEELLEIIARGEALNKFPVVKDAYVIVAGFLP